MTTFDTRFLIFIVLMSFALFYISKIKLREIKAIIWFTLVFMLINNILIYLFAPEQGVEIYGTRHIMFSFSQRYTVTKEQMFYQLNVILKYISMIPLVSLFVSTTNPSEFAASLNRIGINYKICYSVSLALRYIPDIQREYNDISISLQARGVELSRKEKLGKRLKNMASILFPLIISSMQKIEVISNAMELRCFGKEKRRTWYEAEPFNTGDYISLIFCGLMLVLSLYLNWYNHGRYYNPFINA